MRKPIDCQVFQDQLDALAAGALPEDARLELRRHAAECGDCAMLFKMHEHLAEEPLAELEAAAPADLVDSIWPRVQAEIAPQRSSRRPGSRGWRGGPWLLPALAAACAVFLGASGLLLAEVARLRGREHLLVERVAEQERRLTGLDYRTSTAPTARTAPLLNRAAWQRALAREQGVSIAELIDLLAAVPSSTTLLSAAELETLATNAPIWAGAAWREALAGLETGDGLQAGELVRALEALAVDPSRRLPTARLLDLARGALRPGRS